MFEKREVSEHRSSWLPALLIKGSISSSRRHELCRDVSHPHTRLLINGRLRWRERLYLGCKSYNASWREQEVNSAHGCRERWRWLAQEVAWRSCPTAAILRSRRWTSSGRTLSSVTPPDLPTPATMDRYPYLYLLLLPLAYILHIQGLLILLNVSKIISETTLYISFLKKKAPYICYRFSGRDQRVILDLCRPRLPPPAVHEFGYILTHSKWIWSYSYTSAHSNFFAGSASPFLVFQVPSRHFWTIARCSN